MDVESDCAAALINIGLEEKKFIDTFICLPGIVKCDLLRFRLDWLGSSTRILNKLLAESKQLLQLMVQQFSDWHIVTLDGSFFRRFPACYLVALTSMVRQG